MGIVLTKLVEKKNNNRAFSLLEATLVPRDEPPPQVHSREDELFYVLEGEVDLYVGEKAFNVSISECILPRFRPHVFVRTPRLRVLILYTPGGLEEAFSKMSSPAKYLEPPTEVLTYSQSDLTRQPDDSLSMACKSFRRKKSRSNCPYILSRFHVSAKADLIERAS